MSVRALRKIAVSSEESVLLRTYRHGIEKGDDKIAPEAFARLRTALHETVRRDLATLRAPAPLGADFYPKQMDSDTQLAILDAVRIGRVLCFDPNYDGILLKMPSSFVALSQADGVFAYKLPRGSVIKLDTEVGDINLTVLSKEVCDITCGKSDPAPVRVLVRGSVFDDSRIELGFVGITLLPQVGLANGTTLTLPRVWSLDIVFGNEKIITFGLNALATEALS